jgi:peptide-methionine (R)-S-oxide reductase
MRKLIWLVLVLAATTGCGRVSGRGKGEIVEKPNQDAAVPRETPAPVVRIYSAAAGGLTDSPAVIRSDEEWKGKLTPQEYAVMRGKGTEAPFTGRYWDHHANGLYTCAACGADLFTSHEKFDSGCGWPSFVAPVDSANVDFRPDRSHGMERVEVRCRRCGSHLGHVFDDGPAPAGLRYCINSVSLGFSAAGADSGEGW